MSLLSVLVALCLCLSLSRTRAQSLADKLFLQFLPPNEAARAITPPSILFAETPIVVRYTLIGAIAIYEPQAACNKKALSFFGTRDRIRPEYCTERENSILRAYTTYRALLKEFPTEMDGYRQFLLSLELDPVSTSRDVSTLNGWANVYGDRIADFFASDGWNSLGDRTAVNFRQQFEDYTGYSPLNCASADAKSLRRPLRWQPLIVPADGRGRFTSQVHVVPQIAQIKPLVLSFSQVKDREQPSPYKRPNKWAKLSSADFRRTRRFTRELINTSATLSSQRRFLAQWWDNKLLSTASISSFYETAAGLSKFQIAQQFMGEMMSQYDALLVAWKEKLRHDLARPRTILQNVRRGEKFSAFISETRGVGTVRAEDWRPLIPEQPHSEFPSGSAALCTAAMEHLQLYVQDKLGPSRRVPAIKIRFPVGSFSFVRLDQTVSYPGPMAAAMSCGESRLWAGVHFRPSVTAGTKIGTGIGEIVFQHVKLLGEGKVPANCDRCKSR